MFVSVCNVFIDTSSFIIWLGSIGLVGSCDCNCAASSVMNEFVPNTEFDPLDELDEFALELPVGCVVPNNGPDTLPITFLPYALTLSLPESSKIPLPSKFAPTPAS